MTEYKKVFLDTTPLIYFLDDDIHFGLKTRQIFEEILYNDRLLLTSVLTCMEYLVHPYRTNNQAKIKACADFLNDCHIPVLSINLEIATRAAQIRAAYKNISNHWMHYNWQPLVYMDATLFSQTTSSSDNSVKFTASPSTIGLQKDNIMQNSSVAKNSSSSRGSFFAGSISCFSIWFSFYHQ